MQLDHEAHFPAEPTLVAKMLADPVFVAWLGQRSHAGTVELADVLGSAEEGFVVTIRRAIPFEQVLPQIKALVGHGIEIRQTEAWEPERQGRRRGTAAYEITGTPLRALGTTELVANAGGGARLGFNGIITANVPVGGAALERAFAQRLRGLFRETESAGRVWLTDGPQS